MASRPAADNLIWNRQFVDRPPLLLLGIEPGVVEHQKDPLRPAEIVFVGGRQNSIPVVAETEHFQLASEVVDVRLSLNPRMLARLDRMLFGRQPEGVKSHGVQDAFTAAASEPRNDVGRRVPFGMTDMQSIAAGVRKHVQDISFFPARQIGRRERAMLLPNRLASGVQFRRDCIEACEKGATREIKGSAKQSIPVILWNHAMFVRWMCRMHDSLFASDRIHVVDPSKNPMNRVTTTESTCMRNR